MKLSKKKIILIAVLAVLAVLAVFIYNFIADINDPLRAFAGSLNQLEPTGIPEDVIASTPTPIPQPGETPAPSTPTPTIDPMEALAQQADAEYMKNVINILVLGMDKSAERENWGTFRTDTMILLSLNFDKNTIHMISIPRDSYVSIHGKTERGKINSAFSAGGGADKKGYEYAIKTVSNLFGGVKIHHYVGFDMNVVKEVINAMGGVDYDVDIEVSMNGRKLHPGQQHLDGQAVLGLLPPTQGLKRYRPRGPAAADASGHLQAAQECQPDRQYPLHLPGGAEQHRYGSELYADLLPGPVCRQGWVRRYPAAYAGGEFPQHE